MFSWSSHNFRLAIQRRYSPHDPTQSSGSDPITAPGVKRNSKAKLALFPKVSHEESSANVSASKCIADLAASGVGSKIFACYQSFRPPAPFQLQVHPIPCLWIPVPGHSLVCSLSLARDKPDSVASRLQCVSDWFRRIQEFLGNRCAPLWTFNARVLGGDRFAIPFACDIDSTFATHRNPPYGLMPGPMIPFSKQNAT